MPTTCLRKCLNYQGKNICTIQVYGKVRFLLFTYIILYLTGIAHCLNFEKFDLMLLFYVLCFLGSRKNQSIVYVGKENTVHQSVVTGNQDPNVQSRYWFVITNHCRSCSWSGTIISFVKMDENNSTQYKVRLFYWLVNYPFYPSFDITTYIFWLIIRLFIRISVLSLLPMISSYRPLFG